MGRNRSQKRGRALIIWIGEQDKVVEKKILLKDIAKILDVSPEQVRKWKCQDKWDILTLPKKDAVAKYYSYELQPLKYDSWIEIELKYISDIRPKPCKLKDLSQAYNIPYQTIKWHSAKDKWKAGRINYRYLLYQKVQEKTLKLAGIRRY